MTCREVANKVIQMMPKEIVIHRYDSFSTDSIYLKFDYGIGNSLRISGHEGKSNLLYRYNILLYCDDLPLSNSRYYYTQDEIEDVVTDIVRNYYDKVSKITDYDRYLEAVKKKIDYTRGFWSCAKMVDRK